MRRILYKDLIEMRRILSRDGFSHGFDRIGEDLELRRIFYKDLIELRRILSWDGFSKG